jgi:hypothetical protein
VEERRGAGPSARKLLEAREQQRVGFARAAARGERDLFLITDQKKDVRV